MAKTVQFHMPKGLPSSLCSGKEGFDALCELLAIQTTREKQAIRKARYVRKTLKGMGYKSPRQAKTAELCQKELTAFYSNPSARRKLWRVITTAEDESHDPDSSPIPSIEYEVLKRYDEVLLSAELDAQHLQEFPEFHAPEIVDDDWRIVAVAAIKPISEDIAQWDDLSTDRQWDVLMAAFAVSTLLDDVRLLRWAAEQSDDVSMEFQFLGAQSKDTPQVDKGQSPESTVVNPEEVNVLESLRQAAQELSLAASALSENQPSDELFNDVADHAAKVAGMRNSVIELAARRKVEDRVGALEKLLDESSKQGLLRVKDAKEILADWRVVYSGDGASGLSLFQKDIERAVREVPAHFAIWARAQKDEVQARVELRGLQDEILNGVQSEEDSALERMQQEKVTSLGLAKLNAKAKALEVARPAMEVIESPGLPKEPKELGGSESTPPKVSPTPEPSSPPSGGAGESMSSAQATVRDPDGNSPELPTASAGVEVQEQEQEEYTQPQAETEEEAPISPAPAVPDEEIPNAAWAALNKGQLGLAYHIARLSEEVGQTTLNPSSELLATLALGSLVSSPVEEVVHDYERRAANVLSRLDFGDVGQEERKDALNLLVFSASLRPSLFARLQTSAFPLLQRVELSGKFKPVEQFAKAMLRHEDWLRRAYRDVSTLAATFDEGVWKDRWERHLGRVASWRSSAAPKFMFVPTDRVWKHWVGRGGVLAELMDLVSRDNAKLKERVDEIVKLFTPKSVHTLFDHTWRNELGQRIGGGISGRALSQLEHHLQKPVALAESWRQLVDAKPSGTNWARDNVARLRRDIRDHGETALEAIRKCQESNPSLPLRAAMTQAVGAIKSLDDILLHNDGNETVSENWINEILSGDLVQVVELRLDEHGNIDKSVSPPDALASIVDTERHAESLTTAFDVRMENDDIIGARAVYDRMSSENDPNAADYRERLDKAIPEKVRQNHQKLYDLSEKLEQSFIRGAVLEDSYLDLSADIQDTRRILDGHDEDQILAAIRNVRQIDKLVEPIFRDCIGGVEQQLEKFRDRLGADERDLVQDALDAGDLIALHEYIDCLEDNRPLVSNKVGESKTLKAFLDLMNWLAEGREDSESYTQDAVVNAVQRREDMLGLEFSALTGVQARHSASLIEAWYLMDRYRTPDINRLHEILTYLGFSPKSPKEGRRVADTVITVTTEPLRNRELCPVHSFGSTADGHYDVILSWSQSARASIIRSVELNPNRHAIVLHFGRLSIEDRLWLRRWSIKNSAQFIVVDETLVLYLASLTTGMLRLRALFDCTLPFTCVEPFFTAAGLIPPEAFYGRERERREIMERYGSCFVYGGRQLGKTALLRSAETTFHHPDKGHIAHCVDLKKFDIGSASRADHLWEVLWDEFASLNVITGDRRGRPRGRDRLVRSLTEAIADWLSHDKSRQILLLLDEADQFLEDDLKHNFRESSSLKGLMDETKRRFKVVLCGLHNVLRNTERANHPLAHFGTAICVGPLLGNRDWEQARALIKEPMAAAGYTFEKDSLVTYILVWTNYYPSLIQLCGEALLKHLRETKVGDFPRQVTRADIDAVFARDGFRDQIRERFAFTLQLDQRYEVIAYAMAFAVQGDSTGPSRGFSAREVMEYAQDAWWQGFDISRKEFDTLLREMCGLGVLRRRPQVQDSGPALYAFRNPNVLMLLGNGETILGVLEKERFIPAVFEAAAYHAQYPQDNSASARRGPLTYEQEGLLKRGGCVGVLCGTKISNLQECRHFLLQRMSKKLFRPLKPCMDEAGLLRKLKTFRPIRETYVCMVDDSDPWAMRWIESTADMLTRGKVGSTLRVIFPADADRLWGLILELPDDYFVDHANGRFDWVGIQPWDTRFLKQWCDDLNLNEAIPHVDELHELTGGWPCLLEYYAKSSPKTWQGKKDALQKYIATSRIELIEDLGLGSDQVREQITTLRDCGRLTFNEVKMYADLLKEDGEATFPSGTLQRRLFWAIQLGLAQDMGGSWRLNPLVETVLADNNP